jgi:hypothetical protein
MISFADRRLRSEEWHRAGIVVLVRGDDTDPWHTDRCRLQRHLRQHRDGSARTQWGKPVKRGRREDARGAQRSHALARRASSATLADVVLVH